MRKENRGMTRANVLLAVLVGALALALWALVASPHAMADDTGWLSPSANNPDGDGDGFERDPTNAYADGGGFAENRDNGASTWGSTYYTEQHRYYNYGSSIPAGATIQGIEVRLDWWLDDAGGAGDDHEIRVDLSWDGGSSWTTPLKTDTSEPTSEATVVLGGTADLWGRTWSDDEFSNADFRVRVHCYSTQINERDFFLDWVAVRVTYSAGAVGPVDIEKSVSPSLNESPGQLITYNYIITLSNTTPDQWFRIRWVADTLPMGFSYVTGSTTGNPPVAEPSIAGQTITWTYSGSGLRLWPGNTATIAFQATSSNGVGEYCNTVTANWSPGNNTLTKNNLACVTIRWPTFDIETEVMGLRTIVRVRIEGSQPVILSWEIIP
jgi:uncharacterized repeat protein (TIGR01451 family)